MGTIGVSLVRPPLGAHAMRSHVLEGPTTPFERALGEVRGPRPAGAARTPRWLSEENSQFSLRDLITVLDFFFLFVRALIFDIQRCLLKGVPWQAMQLCKE